MNALYVIAVVALGRFSSAQVREPTIPRDNTLSTCINKVADVFFVLDSSTSIWLEDYKPVLQFVSQVITRFDISPEDTRIGALTFSDDFQVGFDIDRHRTKAEVLGSVNDRTLPYKTGVTNTDLAIRYVRENTRFREDITKVMVVITDGVSRSPGDTRREADLARDRGFHMVVVGVGQHTDEGEWRAIASDPDNDYVFNITSYNALETLKDILPRRICQMQPIIVGGECNVVEDANLFFVAAPNGHNDALDVIQKLTDSVSATQRLQVRYFMDICRDTVDYSFQGTQTICDRFGSSAPQDNGTFTRLLSNMKTAAGRMRAGRASNQVAVLFVDDQSIKGDRYNILYESRAITNEGIYIIVVDLGVREFANYASALAAIREDVIDYFGQGSSRSVRLILDRVCLALNEEQFGPVIPAK